MSEDLAMAAIVGLVFFSNGLFAPLLPLFAHDFHVRPIDFQWLVPGFSLVYGAATLAYGILSDRVGRAPVLKWLLYLAVLVLLALSLAKTANQLVILRTISGFGLGGIVTISLSIIGDKYPYAVQGRPMGRMFGAIVAGMGLGASLCPILSPVVSWRWILRILAGLFLLIAVWAQRRYPGSLCHRLRIEISYTILAEYRCVLKAARGSRALLFIIANGCFQGGIFAWLAILLATRYHLRETGIGLTLIGYGVPDLIFGASIGGWADRYGRRYVLPAGFLWAAASAAALAVCTVPWGAGVCISALSVGFDATHPLLSSITTSIDPSHRGQLTGLATFANFFGMAIGALLFRDLLRLGPLTSLMTFAGLEAAVGFAALICFQTERPLPQTA